MFRGRQFSVSLAVIFGNQVQVHTVSGQSLGLYEIALYFLLSSLLASCDPTRHYSRWNRVMARV